MDVDNDGIDEIICGWSTGKLQIRNIQDGRIIYEIELKNEISKLFIGDLNGSSKMQIICCLSNGEIFGYKFTTESESKSKTPSQFIQREKGIYDEELIQYERLIKERDKIKEYLEDIAVKTASFNKQNENKDENVIPSNTKVAIDLQSNNIAVYNIINIFRNAQI